MSWLITFYCACVLCCGKWADGRTFTGVEPRQGWTVACDPKILSMGSLIEIEGLEVGRFFECEDIGSAIKKRHLDVYMDSHADALKLGRKRLPVNIIFKGD